MDIKIENLYKSYEEKTIFRDFNITFKESEVNTIIGKSGCGKTTLLKIISNIIKEDSGTIQGVKDDEISYIFQEDRLIEWLTVKENLKLVLKNSYHKSDLDSVCRKYLNLVGIGEYENYYPKKLSGGIRQRVNIARAFAKPSKLVIMDEPFKSIDVKNKNDIMESFNNALKKDKRTVIFVTHDIDEALYFNGYLYILGNNPAEVKARFSKNDVFKTKEELIGFL